MYKKILIASLLTCISLSCENETLSYFPYALVNFQVSLISGHENGTLTQHGGFYIKEKKLDWERVGYKGVLVYRSHHGNVENEFMAYDIACSNCLSGTIAVSAIPIVKCNNNTCTSEYHLEEFGRAISGPAKERGRRLQSYRAKLVGNIIHISR